MKRTEIAYMAGFFDGEGSITVSLQKGKYLRIEVSCSQNTVDVLWMFVRAFKGRVYKSNRCYQWKTYGSSAVSFLQSLKPFLIIKLVDAEVAIETWQNRYDVNFVTQKIQETRIRHERLKQFHDRISESETDSIR